VENIRIKNAVGLLEIELVKKMKWGDASKYTGINNFDELRVEKHILNGEIMYTLYDSAIAKNLDIYCIIDGSIYLGNIKETEVDCYETIYDD